LRSRETRRESHRYRGAHLGLFTVGLYAGAFGPALPFIAAATGVGLGQAGLLLSALFVGSITASGAVAAVIHARDPRLTAGVGLALVACGLLAIGTADRFAVGLAGAAALGFGDGFVVAATHQAMATGSRPVDTAVNRLNLWFAIGAVVGPLWAGAILSAGGDLRLVYAGIAAVACAAGALILASGSAGDPADGARHGEQAAAPEGRPMVVLMGALLFVYVGAEFGLGAWVSSYAERVAGAGVMEGAAVTAGYWGALALGRVASDMAFARGVRPLRLLAIVSAGSLVASGALLAFGGVLVLGGLAAFATGFAFGPVWPSALAVAARGAPAGTAAVMVTAGNAGGVAIPWLQGRILADAGPRQGVALSVVLCGLMAVLAAISERRSAGGG